jgi:hypothetical protein
LGAPAEEEGERLTLGEAEAVAVAEGWGVVEVEGARDAVGERVPKRADEAERCAEEVALEVRKRDGVGGGEGVGAVGVNVLPSQPSGEGVGEVLPPPTPRARGVAVGLGESAMVGEGESVQAVGEPESEGWLAVGVGEARAEGEVGGVALSAEDGVEEEEAQCEGLGAPLGVGLLVAVIVMEGEKLGGKLVLEIIGEALAEALTRGPEWDAAGEGVEQEETVGEWAEDGDTPNPPPSGEGVVSMESDARAEWVAGGVREGARLEEPT